jgi:dolichol-phosphate mannosyltransferase
VFHVLHRTEKAGIGPAYAAGFAWGLERGYRILCEMDADFSHDPLVIPRLLEAIDGGADVVIGSRYVDRGGVENWPISRRMLSKGGNIYARLFLGTKIKDMTGGYRAFTADSLRRLSPERCKASGYGFQIEMAWRASVLGLSVEEIPITFTDRVRGESKMDATIAWEAIRLIAGWGWGRMRGRLPWPTEPE